MPCREELDAQAPDVTLYPNPAQDRLKIIFSDLYGNEKIEIFNSIGENLFQSDLKNQESEIDIGSLPDGMYFTAIISGEWKKVLKFIKQQ